MTDDEFREMERRLDNWARTVMWGMLREHCGSAEHRYRPPSDLERAGKKNDIDADDGWRIEQAWRTLLPRFRWLLKLHYVRRMTRYTVIKLVAKATGHPIKHWHYKAEIHYAVSQLKKTLDMQRATRLASAPQFENLSARTSVESQMAGFARPEEKKPAQLA